jgi:hypothetical protein
MCIPAQTINRDTLTARNRRQRFSAILRLHSAYICPPRAIVHKYQTVHTQKVSLPNATISCFSFYLRHQICRQAGLIQVCATFHACGTESSCSLLASPSYIPCSNTPPHSSSLASGMTMQTCTRTKNTPGFGSSAQHQWVSTSFNFFYSSSFRTLGFTSTLTSSQKNSLVIRIPPATQSGQHQHPIAFNARESRMVKS